MNGLNDKIEFLDAEIGHLRRDLYYAVWVDKKMGESERRITVDYLNKQIEKMSQELEKLLEEQHLKNKKEYEDMIANMTEDELEAHYENNELQEAERGASLRFSF